MKTPDHQSSLSSEEFYRCLRIIFDSDDTQALIDRDTLARYSTGKDPEEDVTDSRIDVLMVALGLPPKFRHELAIRWLEVFQGDQPTILNLIQAAELLADSVSPDDKSDPIESYVKALSAWLVDVIPSFSSVDQFEPETPQDVRSKYLETAPLFRHWSSEILTHPEWNTIESPIPGIEGLSIDNSWINLNLRRIDPFQMGNANQLSLHFDDRYCGDPAIDLIESVTGLTAILGAPGAGKTTFLKWVMKQIILEPASPFLVPIFVPLRKYALQKRRDENLSIFTFFLNERGITEESQVERWNQLFRMLSRSALAEQSRAKDFFFFLLDGWDEVPEDLRELVLQDVRDLKYLPGLITTRHSANPISIDAYRYYEIIGLSRFAVNELVVHWLKEKNQSSQIDAVLRRIEASPELQRLSRNPFLLTLICSVSIRDGSEVGLEAHDFPANRFLLYRYATNRIIDYHEKKYSAFSRKQRREIEKLAYWLLADAPQAPIYLFDGESVELAIGKDDADELFESLCLSRLVNKPHLFSEEFQFLHTTFQEFFAAKHLNKSELAKFDFRARLYQSSWQEVLALAAGNDDPVFHDLFWKQMRTLLQAPDEFGLLDAKVAAFLAEQNVMDGGIALVGRDLRESLWSQIVKTKKNTPLVLVRAAIALDAGDFARRSLNHYAVLEESGYSTIAAISLVPGQVIADLWEIEKYRETLSQPQVMEFCNLDCIPVDESALCSEQSELKVAMQAAIRMLDQHSAEQLFRAVLQKPDADEGLLGIAILMMASLGDGENVESLWAAFQEDEFYWFRGELFNGLLETGSPRARKLLFSCLAQKSLDDDELGHFLGMLEDHALSLEESRFIVQVAHHSSDPSIREVAVLVLRKCRFWEVNLSLSLLFKQELNHDVQIGLLRSIGEQANDKNVGFLFGLVDLEEDEAICEEAFLALLETVSQNRRSATVKTLYEPIMGLMLSALEEPHSPLGWAAARGAIVLHDERLVKALGSSLLDDAYPNKIRISAAIGLGNLGNRIGLGSLMGVLEMEEKLADEEFLTLHEAATQAIGKIAPEELNEVASPYREFYRREISHSQGVSYFTDRVLDHTGKLLSGTGFEPEVKALPSADEPSPSLFLSHSSEDKEFARTLAGSLRGHGLTVWIDESEIKVGDSLVRIISNGIKTSTFLGVVLSEQSSKSIWVQAEVEQALTLEMESGSVKVLPLRIDDSEVPLYLRGKLFADFRETDTYDQVVANLADRIKSK